MEYIDNVIELTLIFTAGLISPGPDFAIITKLAINNSRRAAIFASLGLAIGVLIHSIYILFGLGKLILNSKIGMMALSLVGGSYLLYIGISSIIAKKGQDTDCDIPKTQDMNPLNALMTGILTNLLNPKAIFFISSLLISVIDRDEPSGPFLLYEAILFFMTLAWFSIVSLFLSTPKIQRKAKAMEVWISRITGSILTIFGSKLILEVLI